MFSIFNKPYPRNNDLKFRLKIVVLSGCFVSVVLFFVFSFQNNVFISPELVRNVLLFGLVTVIATAIINLLLPFLFKNFFKEENWTVAKNIFMWTAMLLVITLGNMLLASYLYNYFISWRSFYNFLYYSVGVGFFVYAIFNLINYNRLLKKNEANAALMNKEISPVNAPGKMEQKNTGDKMENENGLITITSENGKEKLELSLDSLLYIESADNYSKIILERENKLSTSIIRSSLKRVEEQTNHSEIYRCHRAYMVNLKKIKSVSGNSQGYRLHFQNAEETVPVSRVYRKNLLEELKRVSQI